MTTTVLLLLAFFAKQGKLCNMQKKLIEIKSYALCIPFYIYNTVTVSIFLQFLKSRFYICRIVFCALQLHFQEAETLWTERLHTPVNYFPFMRWKIMHICWLFSYHELERFCISIDNLPSIKWKDSVEYFPSMSWKDSEYQLLIVFPPWYWKILNISGFFSLHESPNLLIIFSPWDGKLCFSVDSFSSMRWKDLVNSVPPWDRKLFSFT